MPRVFLIHALLLATALGMAGCGSGSSGAGPVPTPGGVGVIDVQSDPAGARIFLDGRDTGQVTPARLENVATGVHTLECRLSGFHSFSEEVAVSTGDVAFSAPVLTRLGCGRVTGRVVDPEGNGLWGAQVSAVGTQATTRTTAQGVFVLNNVPTGTHTLEARSTSGSLTFIGYRHEVSVADGQLASNMDIMTSVEGASGTITGRVTNVSGAPIAEARVLASQALGTSYLPENMVAPLLTTADASGYYTLRNVPTGFWVITAAAPGFATVSQGRNPPIYVTVGATVTVNFALPAASVSTPQISGTLFARAITMPATALTRGRGLYEAFRQRYPFTRRGRVPTAGASSWPHYRTAPLGSLIEVDLFWDAPAGQNVAGYFIERSVQPTAGFALIEDLLRPDLHAGFWIDYDPRLTPGWVYYYRITAVNTNAVSSSPSGVAQAVPLGQVVVQSPIGGPTPALPTFRWNALPGAAIYSVEVYDRLSERRIDPIWESGLLPATQTSVAYAGPALQSGQTYYWLVAAGNKADGDGSTGLSISQVVPFVVE